MVIKVRRHFDAAHKLVDYKGKCANLHGHRWDVIFSFEIDPMYDLGSNGNISVDFGRLKELIESVLPDHAYLNEVYVEDNPTAEYLSERLFYEANYGIKEEALPLILSSVELFESPDCSVLVGGKVLNHAGS